MKPYLEVMRNLVTLGMSKHPTREGVKTTNATLGLPNQTVQHNMCNGFPLLTTRQLPVKGMVGELRAFLEGCTTNKEFVNKNCKFWTPWADELAKKGAGMPGDLGPIYGAQWQRDLPRILHALQNNPTDRRMVSSCWATEEERDRMALPPCHVLWGVTMYGGCLHLSWWQRSSDWPIGVPINIASYGLLLTRLAQWAQVPAGSLLGTFLDAHFYVNQEDGVLQQLSRTPDKLPRATVKGSLTDFNDWGVSFHDYHPQSNIDFGDLEV